MNSLIDNSPFFLPFREGLISLFVDVADIVRYLFFFFFFSLDR